MYKYITREQKVREFMGVAGQLPQGDTPTPEELQLAFRNLNEEFNELKIEIDFARDAVLQGKVIPIDLKEHMFKEACDLQYVLSGLMITMGFADDFDPAFNRVHSSNMSKFDNGKAVKDKRGKVIKGPSYRKAVLTDLVS